MSVEKLLRDCDFLSPEEMEKMHTRQLLAHLRSTHRWGEYDWTFDDYKAAREYQEQIKAVLATREHIPNKQESKQIRKRKIKEGK